MADIDTSTYPKSQPYDPLKTLGGVANLQNTLNQNRLFQQEFQSKLGLSKIYKEAIDPATGQLDTAKLRSMMDDPNVTLGLPQAYQNSQEAQKRNIDIDTSQLENANKHLSAVSGYYADLMKPGSTSKDVSVALGRALTNHMIEMPRLLEIYSTLPRDQNGQIDESKIPQWAQQQQLQVMDVQQRINAIHPAPTMQQLPGGGMAPFVMPQFGDVHQAGKTIKAAPPPTTTVVGPDGVPRYVGAPEGNNPYEPGAQSGMPGGGAAPGSNIAGQAAGLAPGVAEAASATAHGGAEQGLALQRRAERVPETKAILGNLLAELNTPGFTVGPGTKGVADAAKFMNAQLGTNIRVEGNAAREQFEKLAGMYAQSQFQALGGTGANAQLDATTLTSPNSKLSAMGNRGIIAMLNGNEDAIKAKNEEWQKWSAQHGSGTYGQFVTAFQKNFDPRVFQSQYLDPADKKKMISGLSQQEKNQLHTAFVTAKQNGWIQ